MIFVRGKHTPFAAAAKRRDPAKKFIKFQKNRGWDGALRRVGSALVGHASAAWMQNARAHIADVRGQQAAANMRKAHVCNLGSMPRVAGACLAKVKAAFSEMDMRQDKNLEHSRFD